MSANRGPKRLGVPFTHRGDNTRLVAVEEVLFAEMGDPDLADAFAGAEIDRLAAIFGLSAEEVAELYRPAELEAGRSRRTAPAASPIDTGKISALSPSIWTG